VRALQWAASGADEVRQRALCVATAIAPPWLTRAALRVQVVGAFLVATALVCALCAPRWSVAVAPIIWGVPHLLADLRYLVVRPGFHRRWPLYLAIVVGCTASAFGAGVAGGLLAAAGASLCARAALAKRLGSAVAIIAVAAILFSARGPADLVFAHLHNVVALVFLVCWRPRATPLPTAALALTAAGAALIVSGAADPLLMSASGPTAGVDFDALSRTLTEGMETRLSWRLLALFAFLQSVHYVVWLWLIPAAEHGPKSARSFRQALHALNADVGVLVVTLTVVVALGLGVWALCDLAGARHAYLTVAFGHSYLELAAAALFWLEGPRLITQAASN
jgi:hypothetical protein